MADRITGRPDYIGDYLAKLHSGSWYGWSDSKNRVYSNLIIHPQIWNEEYTGNISADGMMDNPHSKPTEQECTDGLVAMLNAWDAEYAAYKKNRRAAYDKIGDQLDQLYHDIDNNKFGADAKTGTWYLAVKAVKNANPKP